MNNVASITRHLEERFPSHHVVVTLNAWPFELKYELIGPRIDVSPELLDELEKMFGVEQVWCFAMLQANPFLTVIEALSP